MRAVCLCLSCAREACFQIVLGIPYVFTTCSLSIGDSRHGSSCGVLKRVRVHCSSFAETKETSEAAAWVGHSLTTVAPRPSLCCALSGLKDSDVNGGCTFYFSPFVKECFQGA